MLVFVSSLHKFLSLYRVEFREKLLLEKEEQKKLAKERERQLEIEKEERLEKLRMQVNALLRFDLYSTIFDLFVLKKYIWVISFN